MRIALVLDESFDPTDGIQQYMRAVGGWLTTQGHSVYYLVGETKKQNEHGVYSLSRNVRVKFNGNWLSVPLPVRSKKLRELLSTLKIDVLHVQTPYSPFMSGRLIRVAHDTTAVVGTFHILPYSRLAKIGSNLLGKINTNTAKRFDAMMAVSEPAQEFAGSHFGFTSVVVPNAFDYSTFAEAPKKVVTKKKRIVFLGRLVKRKGALSLLKAVHKLHANGNFPADWEVLIGGKGQYRNELETFVEQHKLKNIVRFEGFIEEAAKPAFLAAADIAVFPSTSGESFGISLLEAMAASRGVVLAGDNPGYRSVMEPFKPQLIDPLQTNLFASLLQDWMRSAARRTKAAQAQQAYVQRYAIDIVGKEIERVYKKALRSRRT